MARLLVDLDAPPVPPVASAPDGSSRTLSRVLPADLRASRVLRYGVLGALALYAGLVLVWVLGVPLFGPADERAHVDYAWQVAHGTLPVAGTPFTAEFPELGQAGYTQHVSNHPPLYYAITGPVLRAADALGHPAAGLYALRFLNAAITAATILVVARLAAIITAGASRRVRIACIVAACTLTATNPALVAASGAIQNDALAVLLATLVVTVLAQAVRTGVTRSTTLQVAVLCTLGMLTRVPFVTVALLAVAAVGALTLWPDLRLRRPDPGALVTAIGRAAAVTATVLAGAGWFLLLNLHRYGDLTGGSAVYEMPSVRERNFSAGASDGPLYWLLQPATWWAQLKQLVAPVPSIAGDKVVFSVTTALLLIVLVAGAVAWYRRRTLGPVDRAGALTLLLLSLVLAAAMTKLAVHVSHRGGPNLRYLLDALGLWAVGGAVLLVALRRFAPYALALVAAMSGAAIVSYAAGIILRKDGFDDGHSLEALRVSAQRSIVPAAEAVWVLALLLAVAGLALAVSAIARSTTDLPLDRAGTP